MGFLTKTIHYNCVNHDTPLGGTLKNYATDEFQLETIEDIWNIFIVRSILLLLLVK